MFNATARTMCGAEKVIEIVSYALIAAFGARLVWTKGGGFIRALQAPQPLPSMALAAVAPHDHAGHGHDHHHREHSHSRAHVARRDQRHDDQEHDHAHDQDHVHDEHCGHSHGPVPSELSGPGGWRRGFGTIFAVGLRPCSGAILVLVFALAQGMFWAGITATFVMGLGTAITVATIAVIAVSAKDLARRLSGASEGGGALVMRGLEFGAAGLVLLFGVGLLFGYIAAERVTCL